MNHALRKTPPREPPGLSGPRTLLQGRKPSGRHDIIRRGSDPGAAQTTRLKNRREWPLPCAGGPLGASAGRAAGGQGGDAGGRARPGPRGGAARVGAREGGRSARGRPASRRRSRPFPSGPRRSARPVPHDTASAANFFLPILSRLERNGKWRPRRGVSWRSSGGGHRGGPGRRGPGAP